MKRILLLSDTHSHLDNRIYKYAEECDEIWHGGDIGNISVCDELKKIKPLQAVHGNIDDSKTRIEYPENNIFYCEGVKVLLRHIVGAALKYNPETNELIQREKPQLLVCGHSHILKVQYDNKNELLYMNPGAAGNHGFHQVQTMLRFTIEGKEISNLEVIEWKRKDAK